MSDDPLEEYYPKWLGQAIIEDALPWEEAVALTFQEFSEKYTLHDSDWLTVHYDVAYNGEAILVIRWDAVWLPDEVAGSTPWVKDWPWLFIRIERVHQLSITGYKDIEGISRGIAHAEIVETEGKQLLVIHDHYGGSVDVVFTGKLSFLALDKNKEVLKI